MDNCRGSALRSRDASSSRASRPGCACRRCRHRRQGRLALSRVLGSHDKATLPPPASASPAGGGLPSPARAPGAPPVLVRIARSPWARCQAACSKAPTPVGSSIRDIPATPTPNGIGHALPAAGADPHWDRVTAAGSQRSPLLGSGTYSLQPSPTATGSGHALHTTAADLHWDRVIPARSGRGGIGEPGGEGLGREIARRARYSLGAFLLRVGATSRKNDRT
jgi:hypothetical protein